MNTKDKGNLGENVACGFLQSSGFEIIVRNYRKRWGELDIIAVKDNVLNFFEVKSVTFDPSRSLNTHKAEDNVHGFKVRQIRRMIETFFHEFNDKACGEFRFHILCVYLDMGSRKARVRMIRDVIL